MDWTREEIDDAMGITAGCYKCNGCGWLHGCMDDLCRGSVEDEYCPDAVPCPVCNPEGDFWS